jgi:hypothetical protein
MGGSLLLIIRKRNGDPEIAPSISGSALEYIWAFGAVRPAKNVKEYLTKERSPSAWAPLKAPQWPRDEKTRFLVFSGGWRNWQTRQT